MDGFKKLPKMQHFKEGGTVQRKIENFEKRERKTEEKADIAQDKAIVKKAIRMHDVQEHKGEKTNLSKLNNGGRAKKEVGTVKKYKAGGSIAAAPSKAAVKAKGGLSDQQFLAAGDKDATKRVKDTSKVAATPSKGAVKAPSTPKAFCGGKSVKGYQAGRSVKDPQKLVDDIATEENMQDRELVMGPLRSLKNLAVKGYNKLTGQGAVSDAERDIAQKAAAPSAPVNQSSGVFNKRCGGKVVKK
ncbi:hypothetical protein UFOVP230_89 [uncultured Caudovirales phage]|uniref:Uncharacterized protein n=1 Tax=uncultured Caudovirales phage TaxID=2100421 RepID=A0A6J7XNL5_9CAUD|nr:hypothetical protein UFOVP230_89 [uncultured Caudovirales phage]